jgi:demethylmenaquinone methyltransferase/2-methoxy-6-polyprenyl-1,4-benzoquinol methylase
MGLKDYPWSNKSGRDEQFEEHIRSQQSANFGFIKVPEDEKVDYVRRHFDAVARVYDLMNTLLSFGIHLLWKRDAVKRLKLTAAEKVLDVCGGTGDLSILASNQTGARGFTALFDINWEMMAAGFQRIDSAPHGNRIVHVQGNAEQISFPDHTFDAAMVGFGIRNVTHMDQGFREMYRVLKPGGRFMCLEFSKPTNPVFRTLYDFYSFHIMPLLGQVIAGSRKAYMHLPETIRLFPLPDELARTLEEIGFTRVAYRRYTNGIAVVHTGTKPKSGG